MKPRRALAFMTAVFALPIAMALAIHVADTRAMRDYEPTPVRTYTVRRGDTPWGIVRAHYPESVHTGRMAQRLLELNEIPHAGALPVGRVLILPEARP